MSDFDSDPLDPAAPGQGFDPKASAAAEPPPIVQEAAGTAHKVVDRVADQAHATVDKAAEQSAEIYGRAADGVDRLVRTAEPFLMEKPYLSAGLAAAVGLVVGLLLAQRRTKVIYLRAHP